jgi:hypothetical protein
VPPVVVADPPAAHEHVVAWVKPLVVAPDGHAAQLAEPAAAVYLFTPHLRPRNETVNTPSGVAPTMRDVRSTGAIGACVAGGTGGAGCMR